MVFFVFIILGIHKSLESMDSHLPLFLKMQMVKLGASLLVQTVESPLCKAGDPGSILGSGDPAERNGFHSSILLSMRIPWTGPSGLQFMGSQRQTLSTGNNTLILPPLSPPNTNFRLRRQINLNLQYDLEQLILHRHCLQKLHP